MKSLPIYVQHANSYTRLRSERHQELTFQVVVLLNTLTLLYYSYSGNLFVVHRRQLKEQAEKTTRNRRHPNTTTATTTTDDEMDAIRKLSAVSSTGLSRKHTHSSTSLDRSFHPSYSKNSPMFSPPPSPPSVDPVMVGKDAKRSLFASLGIVWFIAYLQTYWLCSRSLIAAPDVDYIQYDSADRALFIILYVLFLIR